MIIDILDRRQLHMFLSEKDPRSWQPTECTPIYITPFGKEVMACIPGQAVSRGKGGFRPSRAKNPIPSLGFALKIRRLRSWEAITHASADGAVIFWDSRMGALMNTCVHIGVNVHVHTKNTQVSRDCGVGSD